MSSKRYSLYIGRFQPFHNGHEWCVRQMLDKGKKVCIAIMDIHEYEPENNPYQTQEVFKMIMRRFIDEINVGDIEVIEISSVNCLLPSSSIVITVQSNSCSMLNISISFSFCSIIF